jgi:hypothetical protein
MSSAWAASPAYCALFAKEFTRYATVESQGSIRSAHVHDRAYHKCLNLDDEPLLPTAYADPGGTSREPFAAIEGSFAPDEAAPEAQQQLSEHDGDSQVQSGHAIGSREWRAWCSAHFPNSFDPETGTVVPHATGVRTMCR